MAIQVKNDNVLIGHINELENAIDGLDSRLDIVENEFDNYLPLTGGGLTGPLTSSSSITASGGFIGNLTGTASKATSDENGNVIASTYVPISGFHYNGAFTGDLNTVQKPGFYRLNPTCTNASADYSYGQMLVTYGGSDTISQMIFPYSSSDVYVRSGNTVNNSSGTWKAWTQLAATVEKGTYYVRFNSGLQICWGTVGLPKLGANATGSTAVTLAKAFKDTAYGISFVQRTDPGNTWHTGICYVSKTASGMTVGFRNGHSGALSGTGGVYEYIAVGWWK